MTNETKPEASIRTFLEAEEHKTLFCNCPHPLNIYRLEEFDERSAHSIMAHMTGHILDYRAGTLRHDAVSGQAVKAIDQENIDGELRYVYNDLNNISLNEARSTDPNVAPADKPEYSGFGPEQKGCLGADARAELMAESIRAYLQNPNYLKTVAPNVAARIRAAVNPHPELKYVIQFN